MCDRLEKEVLTWVSEQEGKRAKRGMKRIQRNEIKGK